MAKITLAQANDIIAGSFAKASEIGAKPLTVAVLDDGGNLVAFQKQDNSSVLRFDIARGKAYGAIGMGTASRNIENVAKERPHFVNALVGASAGKVVPVAGGLVVKNADGGAIGAIGISGDTSDIDEECGIAGIAATGLVHG